MVPRPDETSTETDSLVALLRRRAGEDPAAELFSYLPDGEAAGTIAMTRGELDRRARALAARLQARGLGGGAPPCWLPPGAWGSSPLSSAPSMRGGSPSPPPRRGPTAR